MVIVQITQRKKMEFFHFPVQRFRHEVKTVILKVVFESVCPILVTIATRWKHSISCAEDPLSIII